MSVMTVRGGIPYVIREGITTTGREVKLPFFIHYLKIRAVTNPAKLYFTKDDFDNNVNFVDVPVSSTSTPYGVWEGPVETTGDQSSVWIKGNGGTSAVELVVFQRRG